MKKNIGTIDRTIRIIIAVTILILAFTKVLTGTFVIIAFILAVILLLTSFAGLCPLYLPLRINTNKKKS